MSISQASGAEPATLPVHHLALLIGMNLIWGLNFVAAKIGLAQFPPIFFTALRFGSLALLLLPFLKIHRGQMVNVLAAGLLTGPVTFALLFAGMAVAEDISTVAIANQMVVPFSTLLSVWLLGERIRGPRILGITLAFAGMTLISFDPRVFAYWDGLALVVLSCFFQSLGLIYVKRLRGIRALQLQAWIAIIGGGLLMLLSLVFESNHMEVVRSADWQAWSALLFTTMLSSLTAYTLWYYLISLYPVTSLSPLTLLSPLFGMFFGVTLLDDQLSPRMIVGSVVTLVGIFIVVMREKNKVDAGT